MTALHKEQLVITVLTITKICIWRFLQPTMRSNNHQTQTIVPNPLLEKHCDYLNTLIHVYIVGDHRSEENPRN